MALGLLHPMKGKAKPFYISAVQQGGLLTLDKGQRLEYGPFTLTDGRNSANQRTMVGNGFGALNERIAAELGLDCALS